MTMVMATAIVMVMTPALALPLALPCCSVFIVRVVGWRWVAMGGGAAEGYDEGEGEDRR
jgi:hypothetical protein